MVASLADCPETLEEAQGIIRDLDGRLRRATMLLRQTKDASQYGSPERLLIELAETQARVRGLEQQLHALVLTRCSGDTGNADRFETTAVDRAVARAEHAEQRASTLAEQLSRHEGCSRWGMADALILDVQHKSTP